jgi:hypothetical protein
MKNGKAVRRVVGNNPAPVAGVLDAADRENPKIPPHEAPIVKEEPRADPTRPEPKRSFIDRLADGFRQIPPGMFTYYRVDL